MIVGNKDGSPERLHALDAVRGFALLGGVVFHASLAFMPGAPVWLVTDASRSAPVAVVSFTLHMFRMTTFFLVAGFFGRMLVERLGSKAFLRNRLKRIGLPLILFWPLVMASIIALMVWSASGKPAAGPPPAWPTLPAFPLTHLWFLYDLLLLCVGALLLRAIATRLDRQQRSARLIDALVRMIGTSPFAPLIPALLLLPVLYSQTTWPMFFGVQTPDMSLIPNAAAAAAFGLAFCCGWLIHRQPEVFKAWAHIWPITLATAVIATVLALMLVGLSNTIQPAPRDWNGLAYYALYGVGAWAWTMTFVGAALRFLSGHSPARRYIADASYWVYIVHLPIVMTLQVALSAWRVSWVIKLPILLALTFGFCFLSYHLLVRRSFIGALLNGKRRGGRDVQGQILALPVQGGAA